MKLHMRRRKRECWHYLKVQINKFLKNNYNGLLEVGWKDF